jgi:class 3 adenylate cyclase/tetratricopeptide (TPR) repeat protein
MSDIYNWLSSLGLSQYTESFEANDIDLEVLDELTESDLAALNISLGHRKKILKAIRKIDSPVEQSESLPPEIPFASATASLEPERRYMTLLFCDLADSTRIAAGLDIEDMHDINRAYQIACTEAINKFGGFVARYMGDGVLAYFGYPAAREDDAERAVLASLEITRKIKKLGDQFTLFDGMTLSVRVGIATGQVVVETIGDGTTKENAVVGEAPNLAARLQGLAEPNSILVGPDTYRLVQDTFEFTKLGKKPIKGYMDPLPVWLVKQERPVEQRFSKKRSRHLTPLIGREEELTLLVSRWKRTVAGEGQVVLLSGEAGMGKSRLIESLLEEINEPYQLLRFYCSPYHSRSPLHPYLTNLIRESGISPEDDDEKQYSKIKDLLLGQYEFDENFLHTITSLISLNVKAESKTNETDPQRQLLLAQENLIRSVMNHSRKEPVLIVVEDTHWIDPSTLKVLELLINRNHDHAVMLLLSRRMEKPAHYAQSHITNLSLSKLTSRQSEQLINEISKNIGLDESVVHSISEKSAGIPLFIEEVTKVMLDSRGDQSGFDKPQSVRVPDTLQASLLAMLDRLGTAKQLAQCASVIGGAFEKMILGHISELVNDTVDSGIEVLVDQNIVYRQSGVTDTRYRFRHALLRDAAYESLLKKTRRKIHGMAADYLSSAEKTGLNTGKDVIAYHYDQAGDNVNAFRYWLEAGESAFNSGATTEAVELLDNAVSHLGSFAPSEINLDRVYRLHMTRGRALNASLGAVSEEAHASFRNAVTIAREIGNIEQVIDALDWEFGITFNAGMLRKSLVPAQTMLEIGDDNDHLAARISGHQVLGMAYCALGEFDQSRQHLESALDTEGQEVSGLNCYPSMTLDYLSYVKYFIGDRESALSLCNQAIESARLESDYATASALSNSCFTQMLLGNTDKVLEYSEEVIDLARDRGQHMFTNRGLLFQNLALASIDQDPQALEKVVRATNTLLESKEEIDLSYLLGMTAEIQISLGDFDAAGESLDRALALSEKNEEMFYRAELLRLAAELSLASEVESGAEKKSATEITSYLDEAMAIANQQNANSWIDKIRTTKNLVADRV